MDREEKQFYTAVSGELDRLRALGAVEETGEELLAAMEEAAERAERVAREARFLQLDTVADEAEGIARSAREVTDHDSLGLFLGALFSFHDHLSREEAAATPPATDRKDAYRNPESGEGSGSSVELVFDTPPSQLFELDYLERKLILDALDQGERIYYLSARSRDGDLGVLKKLLYRLEEELHVIRTVGPRVEGGGARLDLLCASGNERESVTAVLAEDEQLREASLREVSPERLALSIDRQDLKISRGVLAGLREVELRLGSEEYEGYMLLQGVVRAELRSAIKQAGNSAVVNALERIERIAGASTGTLLERSGRSALDIVDDLASWLETERKTPGLLRIRVEGGDGHALESPVAQLTKEVLQDAVTLLLRTGDTGGLGENGTPVELLVEIEEEADTHLFSVTLVSPGLFDVEVLGQLLADSSGRYVAEELLSGSLGTVERRGSAGIALSVPRGGHTMTVLIARSGKREIAFPAATVIEAQPLFQRLVALSADGRVFFRFRGSNLPIYTAQGEAIGHGDLPSEGVVVILKVGERSVAIRVDELLSEESVIRTGDAPEQVFVESLGRKLPFFFPVELF